MTTVICNPIIRLYIGSMFVTLAFPDYLKLSGFLANTDNSSMEINLNKKTLTARFTDADITKAKEQFSAVEQHEELLAESPVSRNNRY